MNSFRSNFGVPKFLWHRFTTVRLLYRSLSLLFLVAFLAGGAAAADVPSAPATSLGPDLSFSIADFDGDSKPDLASVHYGTSDSTRTYYWIQLQLSAAGLQSFQIVAPIGGLQIIPRDVNGDHALDLVLTTVWLRQPVAILLNDGNGNFSRVDPDAFPEAFTESKPSWDSTPDHTVDTLGPPPQSREEIYSRPELFFHQRARARFTTSLDGRFAGAPFLSSHPGRAPPFEVSLS